MRSGIIGFILGALLAGSALFLFHRAPHKPPPPPAATAPLVTEGTLTVPRWHDVVPSAFSGDWSKEGLCVNVLQDVSGLPSGSTNVPARAFFAWNKDAFGVRVEVDAPQTIEDQKDDQLYRADSVELHFFAGPDLKQSCQVIVAPGLDPQHPAKREMIGKAPEASPKPFPVQTTARKTASGYAVEYSLPWSAFGVTPEAGQSCAVQVVINRRQDGDIQHLAWYPSADTLAFPEHKIALVLGDYANASPPVNSLARVMALNPRMGEVAFTFAPDAERGHMLTVRHKGETLYRREIQNEASPLIDYFSFPAGWNDSEPLLVCDNEKILATLSADEVLTQIKNLANNLTYRFGSSVFGEDSFPHGGFDQDAFVRRFFAPVQVTTKFYDAQYHEVNHADKPGRYGAVMRIHLNGGTELTKFITLYRMPTAIHWRETTLPMSVQFPAELGLNPAVLRNQQPEISEGFKKFFMDDIGRAQNPAILLAGLSETSPDAPPAVRRTNAWTRDVEWWDGLRQSIGMGVTYQYLTDLPVGYADDPDKRWPLILSLHGSGPGGGTMEVERKNRLAVMMGKDRHLPAIILSPICPYEDWWQPHVLSRLLDEVSAKYRVDPDRIYVTGLSMGGFGTWDLAMTYPERFAAIAPICGEGDTLDAARLKHLPIWTFQGQKDDRVPFYMTVNMVEAIRKAGGAAHLTLYPDVRHNSWVKAYTTDALYTWLLAQKRGQPEVKTPGVPTP